MTGNFAGLFVVGRNIESTGTAFQSELLFPDKIACTGNFYGNQPPVYYNQPPMNNQVPEEYRPIGMWGYFGYELLFMIPIVGLIMVLIFSFGGTANKNLKNFARSQFCIWIVIAVLAVIAFSFGLFAPALLGNGGPGFTSTHYYPYY